MSHQDVDSGGPMHTDSRDNSPPAFDSGPPGTDSPEGTRMHMDSRENSPSAGYGGPPGTPPREGTPMHTDSRDGSPSADSLLQFHRYGETSFCDAVLNEAIVVPPGESITQYSTLVEHFHQAPFLRKSFATAFRTYPLPPLFCFILRALN